MTLHLASGIKRVPVSMIQELEAMKERIVEYVVEREMTHTAVVKILRTDHGIHTSDNAVSVFCSKHGM